MQYPGQIKVTVIRETRRGRLRQVELQPVKLEGQIALCGSALFVSGRVAQIHHHHICADALVSHQTQSTPQFPKSITQIART